ncbi:hypothetical protein PtA15_9A397 [Puccinia triticina]|uniref:RING-type domain-containing protein n=1 Tax=Puccinia triticina TaxID=208348 RepID=A0ABY7CTE7_9BASI|nr:uncharacterized protein PtA15_9A397 [Puccinia triticina]WAQ88270.1 hypothetical protein PtA15_9A397 [Puccinia triticina]
MIHQNSSSDRTANGGNTGKVITTLQSDLLYTRTGRPCTESWCNPWDGGVLGDLVGFLEDLLEADVEILPLKLERAELGLRALETLHELVREVKHVTEIIGIARKDAALVLQYFGWNKELLMERYMAKIKEGKSGTIECVESKCKQIGDKNTIVNLLTARDANLPEANTLMARFQTLLNHTFKCKDDSEMANWISANTKECTRCHLTIEKNGGCNHVTCKKCKPEFCWVCTGIWADHGTA